MFIEKNQTKRISRSAAACSSSHQRPEEIALFIGHIKSLQQSSIFFTKTFGGVMSLLVLDVSNCGGQL